MNFLFLMDPLETVVMEKDTTFAFMMGAHRRGHKVFYIPDGGIAFREGQLFFTATPVEPQLDDADPFVEHEPLLLEESDADVIFIRNDPPFDQQYLFNTWMLDKLAHRIPIINNPFGIRTVNEKLWATQFTSIIPKTLVSRQKEDMVDFISDIGHVVAKPLDGFGGQGIFQIKKGDPNTNVIMETLSKRWTQDIIMQQYIPAAQEGDKRILLLDGDPLGAVLRVHAKDDHRNNFFAGGKPQKADITERDAEIIETLNPHLKRLGLYFVGIDVIGDCLIEVNVTSPTCLQEMNRLYNVRLEDDVIDFAENLVED